MTDCRVFGGQRTKNRPTPWIRVAPLIALLTVLAACGGDDLQLTATAHDTRFVVKPGDQFSVVLKSNPTTGYVWALTEPLPSEVLRLVEDRYHEPETELVGAPGLQELVFEGVADGSTYIQLWYVRSFDDPPAPAERAQFEVIVGSGVPARSDDADQDDQPQPAIPDDESAVSVSEVQDAQVGAEVVVRGALFDDGSGLVLCGALAESFPPQCPGESVAIANPDQVDLELASSGGVRWSEQPVTILGVATTTGLEVRIAQLGAS